MSNVFSSIKNAWSKLGKGRKVILIVSALVLVLIASGGVYLMVHTGQPADVASVTPSPTPAPTLLIKPTPIPRPEAPTGFIAQYTGHSIILNWNAGEDDVTYTIWRSGELITMDQTENFFIDEEYNQDNTYAIMAGQDGNVSESVPLRVHVDPPAPTDLNASFDIETKAVHLSWDCAGNDCTFIVCAKRGGQSDPAYIIEDISDTSYIDAEADYDTAYTYSVTAVDPRSIISEPVDIDIKTDPRPIPEYTLTMAIQDFVVGGERGTVEPDKSSHVYQEGTVVNIVAHPDTGYFFDHWEMTGAGIIADSQSSHTTVTLTGDCTVTAFFSVWAYAVYVDVFPWGSGNVYCNDMSARYTYGEEVKLSAEPAEGYEFNYWSGAPSMANNYDRYLHFTMPDRDVYLTAYFREEYSFGSDYDFDYEYDYDYDWEPLW